MTFKTFCRDDYSTIKKNQLNSTRNLSNPIYLKSQKNHHSTTDSITNTLTESRSFGRWHPLGQQRLYTGEDASLSQTSRYSAADNCRPAVANRQHGYQQVQTRAHEHTAGEQLLGTSRIGYVAARQLRHYVAPEERAEDHRVRLRVPVEFL